jgi:glycosyltransferase involved in cell wall biosynthesis
MILHVIDNLRPESGGPTTVVIELACQQARLGRRVHVLCVEGPRQPELHQKLVKRFGEAGVGFTELRGSDNRRAQIAREVDLRKPQVIHLHSLWESILRETSGIARRRAVPYVISTHGVLHPYALSQKRWKKWVYLKLFPGLVGGATALLALNREEANHISAKFARPATVLANGIDVADHLDPESGEFRRTLLSGSTQPFILFVGRIHPIKGLDGLLRSFAMAIKMGLEHDLVVVGPDDGALPDLRELASQLGLRERVRFTGGVFGPVKADAYASCALFVHRPRFEGFGMTVVEAMASARPVLTTKECKLDGAAESGAVLQAADDDQRFAEAIVGILRNPGQAQALGERGRRWARENLDWRALVERLDRIYEGQIDGP